MIIIKSVILYFIQIRHTDDFPSTGTRLVKLIIRLKNSRWLFYDNGNGGLSDRFMFVLHNMSNDNNYFMMLQNVHRTLCEFLTL